MTYKKRTIIFIIFAFIFAIITPIVIMYSFGWRIDWKQKKMFKTGIFYFKVAPKNVQIYINGNLSKKTDLFFGSAIIQNLLPGRYNVEIKKDEFNSWQKNLDVAEDKATELKNILLIPQNPIFSAIGQQEQNFYVSPDEKFLALEEKETQGNNGWALKLLEPDKNVKSKLVGEIDFLEKNKTTGKTTGSADLVNLKFSPDSKKILLEISSGENLKFYLLSADKAGSDLFYFDNFKLSNFEEIYFNPKNSQELFFLNEKELNKIDLIKKEGSLILEGITSFIVRDDNFYYIKEDGFLYKNNLSLSSEEKINSSPISIKNETEYRIFFSPYSIILKEGNNIYWLDKKEGNFKKLSGEGNSIIISPNGKKLAYSTGKEIKILFLDKQYDQPEKEIGEQIFLTRFSEDIKNLFWYGNYYLIFSTADKIKIAETDDRDTLNIYDLAEYPSPKIFWSDIYKKLYLLSGNNLYVSNKLTAQY